MHCLNTGLGALGAHPDPTCAHRPCALRPGWPCRGRVVGRVAACGQSCRRPSWPCLGHVADLAPTVSWPCAASRLCAPYHALYRPARHRVARLQRHIVAFPTPCHACLAIQPSSQASCCIATHKAASNRNTICIATLPGQATLLSRYKRLYRDTHQWPGHSPVTIQLIIL